MKQQNLYRNSTDIPRKKIENMKQNTSRTVLYNAPLILYSLFKLFCGWRNRENTGSGLFEADHAKQHVRSREVSSKVKQMLRSCKAVWHLTCQYLHSKSQWLTLASVHSVSPNDWHLPLCTQWVPMTDTCHCALSESQWLTLASVHSVSPNDWHLPVCTHPVPTTDTCQYLHSQSQ